MSRRGNRCWRFAPANQMFGPDGLTNTRAVCSNALTSQVPDGTLLLTVHSVSALFVVVSTNVLSLGLTSLMLPTVFGVHDCVAPEAAGANVHNAQPRVSSSATISSAQLVTEVTAILENSTVLSWVALSVQIADRGNECRQLHRGASARARVVDFDVERCDG